MKQVIAIAAGLLAASLAQANTPVLINFETPTSFEFITEHYNGGTDTAGVAGANVGVSFTADAMFPPDAMALKNDAFSTFFSNAPSPNGVMAPVGPNAIMNVAAGFTGTVSFWYSSNSLVLQGANVYAGLNGTGKLLASFNLVENAQADGCTSAPYCRFDQLTSSFFGTAKSITFGKAANMAAFDNISITAVPEPTTVLMMSLGLAALALGRRRS